MTTEERQKLIRFVIAREWVVLLAGLLMVGVSLSATIGPHVSERASGIVLAVLLLLAMALFVWMRAEDDLAAGEVMREEIILAGKETERHEAAIMRFIYDLDGRRYQVSRICYDNLKKGQSYELLYTSEQRIVLEAKAHQEGDQEQEKEFWLS